MTASPVTIIIPAFNQVDYCRQCIQTIQAATQTPYRLVLIDNGSTDGVAEFFDSIEGAAVIHNETNLGFPKAVNQGLRLANGHALLLNSDTLVPHGWLDRLLAALHSADDIGAVGPRTNYAPGPQQLDGLNFTSWDEINAFAAQRAETYAGQLTECHRLVGFCMLIRDTALQTVGLFDERFGIGNFEDDDYCLRIARAGFRLCIAQDGFVFHYGSRTFAAMGLTDERFGGIMAENERKLQEKWGKQAAEHSPHALRSRQINREARRAIERSDWVEAVHLLKEAIAAHPGLAVNYNDLGAALWQMGERARAYDAFAKAVSIDPKFEDSRTNLREAAKALGRLPEAERHIAEAEQA